MRQGCSYHGIFPPSLRYGSVLISPRELQFVFLPSFHDAIHKMPALALAVLTRVQRPQTGRVCSSQVAHEVARQPARSLHLDIALASLSSPR